MFRRVNSSRFNQYKLQGNLADPRAIGLVAPKSIWSLATPSLDRPEEDSIVATNTFNQDTIVLRFKWRPNSSLVTLSSYLALRLDAKSYFYEDLITYAPKQSSVYPPFVTQLGEEGAPLRLIINNPYRQYRIIFRGYMRTTDESGDCKKVFVKLNLLGHVTSQVYDFLNDYDIKLMTNQAARLGTKPKPVDAILHDRHEHCIKLIGQCNLTGDRQIHLWGFNTRQFVGALGNKPECKRLFGHLDNDRVFQVAAIKHQDQFSNCGYVCFRHGPAVRPLTDSTFSWTKDLSGDEFDLIVAGHDVTVEVRARRRYDCEFYDLFISETRRGWAFMVAEEPTDSDVEVAQFRRSLDEYRRAIACGDILGSMEYDPPQTDQKLLAIDLDQPMCQLPSLVGAKAASLAHLRYRSKCSEEPVFKVAPAVVLTRYAYEYIQEDNPQLQHRVQDLATKIGEVNLDTFDTDCKVLQHLYETEDLVRKDLQIQLEHVMRSSFGIINLDNLDGRSFAVRSSSWGEDEQDMSAAGQLTTVLNVESFENIRTSIKRCYASKFNTTNIEYKRQRGMPLDLPMSVIIQEMVDCDKAGVMFTCDPTEGDSLTYIVTANYGLGESVVSGQADPDTIKIRRDSGSFRIDEIKIGSKRVVMRAANHGQQVDTSRCCLSNDEILHLARCGENVSGYFRCQRDIEWGFKNSELYLFQSRPVTGLDNYSELELMHEADKPSRAEREFSSRANVNEVMPFANSPLNLSFSIKLWVIAYFYHFPIIGDLNIDDYSLDVDLDSITDSYHNFHTLRGKAFFNFAQPEGTERPALARAIEIAMFGREINNEELIKTANELSLPTKSPKFAALRFLLGTWQMLLFAESTMTRGFELMSRLRLEVTSETLIRRKGSLSRAERLLEQVFALIEHCIRPMVDHIVVSMIASKQNVEIMGILSKYVSDPSRVYAILSRLLKSNSNVLSANIPKSIAHMAKTIRDLGEDQAEAFIGMKPSEGLKFILSNLDSNLARQFNDFLAKFGHRCYDEFEISKPAWRDQPEQVVEMLQTNVRCRPKLETDISHAECRETVDLDKLIESLGIGCSLADRLKLKYSLIPKCLKYTSSRERTKNTVIYFIDIVREAFRMLARELTLLNRLPDDDLLFYFFLHEVEALVHGPQPSLVSQASCRRRLFKKHFQKPWRYDEIVEGHILVPLHLQQVVELDDAIANAEKLYGTVASRGLVQAKVCIIDSYNELSKVRAGCILVTYSTDIAFSAVFPLISGVITEVGGLISHGAVVAREYGLPSVIGVPNVTKILRDDEEVILDADNGFIVRLNKEQG